MISETTDYEATARLLPSTERSTETGPAPVAALEIGVMWPDAESDAE